MDVDFRILRHLIVDDGGQILDIQSTSGHVGGDQHAATAVGEAHQHLIALALLQIAMQCQHRNIAGAQGIMHRLTLALGVTEHHAGVGLEVGQDLQQGRSPSAALYLEETLIDVAAVVGGLDTDFDGIFLHLGADPGDFIRIGGGEEQGLASLGGLADHINHHIGKAHVQHPVGFVQYQYLQMFQTQTVAMQVVLNTPRCADDDMRGMGQGVQLWPHGNATTQG